MLLSLHINHGYCTFEGFPTTAAISNLRAIPKGVWTLGFASMFMDISSEMIHALLPIYLVSILGATTLTVGFIEGISEGTASSNFSTLSPTGSEGVSSSQLWGRR